MTVRSVCLSVNEILKRAKGIIMREYEAKDRQKCATSDWSKMVLLRLLLKIDHKKGANHVLTDTNAGRHTSIVRSRDQFPIRV